MNQNSPVNINFDELFSINQEIVEIMNEISIKADERKKLKALKMRKTEHKSHIKEPYTLRAVFRWNKKNIFVSRVTRFCYLDTLKVQ